MTRRGIPTNVILQFPTKTAAQKFLREGFLAAERAGAPEYIFFTLKEDAETGGAEGDDYQTWENIKFIDTENG